MAPGGVAAAEEAAFLEALRRGEVGRARAMLAGNGALAGATDADGTSALLLAAYHGHRGFALEIARRRGSLGIVEAAAVGDLSRVKEVLDADPGQVTATAPPGFTALDLAAHYGHRAIVELLLDRGADPQAPPRNPMGYTALTGAVAAGHAEIAELLLARGADANYRYGGGHTPLHEAAAHGDVRIVAALLAHGARPDAADDRGQTPLALALLGGHREVIQLLRRPGARG